MKYAFTLTFLFFLNEIIAQSDLKFINISTDHGLSQSVVQCILKDSKGFMWFGTRDGLNKYDGNGFVIYKYDADKKGSISNNYINYLFEDSKGYLWVATRSGLNIFDRKKNSFKLFDLGNDSGVYVCSIFQDSKGNIWITTRKGLFLIDPNTNSYKAYKHSANTNSINNDDVTAITEYNGDLWVGTANGLNRFNPANQTFVSYKNDQANARSFKNNYIAIVYRDSKNNLLVGTEGGGFNQYDQKSNSFFMPNISSGLCKFGVKDEIKCFNEDKYNNLWIGTENNGFYIYNYTTKSIRCYKNDPENSASLINNSIRAIYKDDTGNMWLGTYAAGVEFVPDVPDKFMHYKSNYGSSNGLNNNIVKAILEDNDGNLWLATDGGGINFFDKKNNKFTYLKNDSTDLNTISSNTSHAIMALNEDTLVFAHHRGGFDFYNKKTGKFTHFKDDIKASDGQGGNTTSSLYKDKEGILWIGAWSAGLYSYNLKTRKFKRYINNPADPESISCNLVFSIKEDREGNLWLATNKGVELFDRKNEKFIHYLCDTTKIEKTTCNIVYCIHIDQKNNLWAGTMGGGLNLLNKKTKTFTTFKEKDGLPNNVIEGILEDGKGNLWISTNKGISKFNLQTKSFRNYGVEDGLQGNEFKRNSYFKNKKGDMYFGGIGGFSVFNPDHIKYNPVIPKVVFTGFQIFNKTVEPGGKGSPLQEDISETKEITLAYHQSVFTFRFAALNYIHPERNWYAYKLEGFDETWNYTMTEKKASYTNLDPGKYIFRVKASNNDEIWNEEGASITLIITPPYWKTWWFRTVFALIILGSAFAWYQTRMNIVKKQKEKLELLVKERTEELQTLADNLSVKTQNLQEANVEIKDSIRAAQAIQNVILPSESAIKKHFPESFILYRPKDIVSGDFYWFDAGDDKIIIAAVDCTGHGVSGAFMSINAHHLLNQVINTQKNLAADEILNKLNENIIKEFSLDKNNTQIYDGMDIALCIIERGKRRVQYAGANNPLYILRNNAIRKVRANKFAMGQPVRGKVSMFTNNIIEVEENDIFYIFSDGYADQIGGPTGDEKYMYPRFRNKLLQISNQNMDAQLHALSTGFDEWKGTHEQMDDVLIIGFKVLLS